MQPPITPDAFKELIKTLRYQYISLPEQMVYNSFASIINGLRRAFPIYPNLEQLILNQASAVIEQTRAQNWTQYRKSEKDLCIALISQLLPTATLQQLTPEQTQSLVYARLLLRPCSVKHPVPW